MESIRAQKDESSEVDDGRLQRIFSEAEDNRIKAPDLQSYYERQAKGKSVIDDFSGVEYERNIEEEEIQRLQADQHDEDEYRRELLARLVGGKMTARQYAVFMNMSMDELQQIKLEKQKEEKMKVEAKDEIRNIEELLESRRREKVLQGQWPEADSHMLLQQELDEALVKFPTASSFQIFMREWKKQEVAAREMRNSSQILEREYYFDEGLGQSLNEHTAELRKQYPNVDLQIRRDNDGFPIIKLAMKREYKYNIDDIINTDSEQLIQSQNETLEALLGVFMPEDPKEFIEKAAAGDAFDGIDQEALDNLIQKRFEGEYKDDLEGFKLQCQLLR